MKDKRISQRAANSAIIIIIFTLGSKVLGFLRESFIAYRFGSTGETDAFVVALTATSILTRLLGATITTTFIPVLFEINMKEGQEGKLAHTDNLITITALMGFLLSLLTWFAAPIMAKVLAIGFDKEQFDLTVKLIKLGSPKVLFSIIAGVLAGYLQSEHRHFSSAAQGFPFNFIYIFFLVVFSTRFGIEGLMVAALVANLSQILIHIPSLRRAGYRYRPKLDLRDHYILKVAALSAPIFVGTAINDLNTIIDRTLASRLVEGSISALNYSNKLKSLIQTVFIAAITTVIFPILAKNSSSDNRQGFLDALDYGIHLILFITIPATLVMVVLAQPIVEIAFKRGEFGDSASLMTYQALIFYSLGLVSMSLRPLLTRAYYSIQDTRTPMINSLVSIISNVVFNLILIGPLAHKGLALATSISVSISTLWLYLRLEKRMGKLNIKGHLILSLKLLLASGAFSLTSYLAFNKLSELLGSLNFMGLISLGLAGLLGLIVYLGLAYLMKLDIFISLLDQLLGRFAKN